MWYKLLAFKNFKSNFKCYRYEQLNIDLLRFYGYVAARVGLLCLIFLSMKCDCGFTNPSYIPKPCQVLGTF